MNDDVRFSKEMKMFNSKIIINYCLLVIQVFNLSQKNKMIHCYEFK